MKPLCFLIAGCSLIIASGPIHADEPLTEEAVKEAFSKAIESTGYRVGEKTLTAIEVDATRITKNLNDMRGATLHVDESEGYRHGFCYCLFANNTIERAGYYREGKRVGPWRFYFPNGQLKTAPVYDEQGLKQAQTLTFFENGKIHQVELFQDGKLIGSKSTFYDNGHLRLQQQYSNGIMNGLSIIYWPNGNRKKFGFFDNGQQSGPVMYYNEDGSLKEQAFYIGGVRQNSQ